VNADLVIGDPHVEHGFTRHHGVPAFNGLHKELIMSRTLTSLRASLTLGAFLLAGGALHSAHAADAPAQRLAMARTSEAVVYKAAPAQARQVTQRADITVAKAPVRRTQESRSDSDGTRFTYDSCGCSN
jgi:hypothetical protein